MPMARRAKKICIIFTLLITLSLVLGGRASANTAIGVDPTKLQFALKAGEESSGKVRVSNEGDEPLDLISIYLADVGVDKEGETSFVVPTGYESPAKSPALWIKLSTASPTRVKYNLPYVKLATREFQDVNFWIDVPDDARPGDHTAFLFFEVRKLIGKGTGSAVAGRIGAKIKIRVAGSLVEKLVIDRLDLPAIVFGNTAPYVIGLRNEGNVDHKPTVTISILSGAERSNEVGVEADEVYAGNRANIKGEYWLGNFPGFRTVKVSAAYGSNFVDRTTQVFVVPYWLAMLTMVLALSLLYLAYRILRKGAREGSMDGDCGDLMSRR
ncbi:MAG: hypothetical protein M1548_07580 [Actinobacteria bacterium]|nr:hypothetical protein [Actinomycetota bacterium]